MQSFSRDPLLSAIIWNLFIKPNSRLICTITDEIAQYLFTNTSKEEKSKKCFFSEEKLEQQWLLNKVFVPHFFGHAEFIEAFFFVYKIARNNKSTTSRVGERVQDRKKGISREPAHFHLPVWCALIYPKKNNRISSPVATVFVLTENDGEATKRFFFRFVPNNDLQVRLLFSFLFTASLFRLRYSLFLEFLVSLHRPRDNSRYFFFLHFTSWTIACKTLCIAFMTFSITLWLEFLGKWSSRTFNARNCE